MRLHRWLVAVASLGAADATGAPKPKHETPKFTELSEHLDGMADVAPSTGRYVGVAFVDAIWTTKDIPAGPAADAHYLITIGDHDVRSMPRGTTHSLTAVAQLASLDDGTLAPLTNAPPIDVSGSIADSVARLDSWLVKNDAKIERELKNALGKTTVPSGVQVADETSRMIVPAWNAKTQRLRVTLRLNHIRRFDSIKKRRVMKGCVGGLACKAVEEEHTVTTLWEVDVAFEVEYDDHGNALVERVALDHRDSASND